MRHISLFFFWRIIPFRGTLKSKLGQRPTHCNKPSRGAFTMEWSRFLFNQVLRNVVFWRARFSVISFSICPSNFLLFQIALLLSVKNKRFFRELTGINSSRLRAQMNVLKSGGGGGHVGSFLFSAGRRARFTRNFPHK